MNTKKINKLYLHNRYTKHQDYLELIGIQDNIFIYKIVPDLTYIKFWRIIGDSLEHPIAIDPPGGPYMALGKKLNDMTIIDINFKDMIIKLKKDE